MSLSDEIALAVGVVVGAAVAWAAIVTGYMAISGEWESTRAVR